MRIRAKKYALILLAAVMAFAVIAAIGFNQKAYASESVETNRFTMLEGASIRLPSPKGLRFIAEMGPSVYDSLMSAEANVTKKMGMIIVPSSYIEDSSKYSDGISGVKAKSYNKITKKIDLLFYSSDGSTENKIYQDGDYYYANGVISNLLLNNYDREFIGIGYISRTESGVTTYTFADFEKSANARSALYVAKKAYDDYEGANKALIGEYISGAYLKYSGLTETVSGEAGSRTFSYSYGGKEYSSITEVNAEANCNVSLLKFDGTFETLSSVPAYLKKSNDAGTLEIVTKDGDKCLKIPTTGNNPRFIVTTEFLAAYFADPNVQYLAFDARSETASLQTFRYHSGSATPYYEFNDSNYGIRPQWKTFFFPRSAYEACTKTEDYIIYGTGFTNGDAIYVDNFRPLTSAEYLEELYGFESGRIYLSGANILYYPVNSPDTSTWQIAINCDKTPTAYGVTYENVSHGIRALTFTKPAGTYKVRLNTSTAKTDLTSTGYYAFDLYVPADADTTLAGTIRNDSTYYHIGNTKAGAWTTVYVNNSQNYPVSITDTTGGTYVIDHFRSITASEFDAADSRWLVEKSDRFHFYEGADFRRETSSYNSYSLRVMGGSSLISNPKLDGNNTHGSAYSFSFDKIATGEVSLYLNASSAVYSEAATKGFTFWIYSTVGFNGVGADNFLNGNRIKFNSTGITLSANTWTKITITSSDMTNDKRFLLLRGSPTGTIYIDDIQPLA